MKAAVIYSYGKPEVFQIQDMPVPEIKANEVLIKVYASSVNPIDWKLRQGMLKYVFGSAFPIVPGYDVAGEIVKTGAEVKKFKTGDPVFCRLKNKYGGGYAQFAPAREDILAMKPEEISFHEAASVPLAALTALQALRDQGKIKKGDKVLINGAAGGVGHFALQIAKYYGAHVTAVCSSRHTKMMDELKPDVWIDYNTSDFLHGKEKYNIIYDVVGNKNFFSCFSKLTGKGAYITTQPYPSDFIQVGLSALIPGKSSHVIWVKSVGKDLEFLANLVKEGKMVPYIDKTFRLEDISLAHEYAESGHIEGKIVIEIT
jgi:2-desacetyl-2-hydroxyethyl bacteriochlorophyllide A dehydrogenase